MATVSFRSFGQHRAASSLGYLRRPESTLLSSTPSTALSERPKLSSPPWPPASASNPQVRLSLAPSEHFRGRAIPWFI
ncbi:hypothetical protein ZWY2020_043616 [Hordeum vulgare]|nr:hypothetical protein ZWY2020_043616 [Hordeum vulgare]